jgi:hypothetical protein
MLGAMPATTYGHIAPSGPAPPRGGPGLPRVIAMWVRSPRPDCPGPAASGPAAWPTGSGSAGCSACSGCPACSGCSGRSACSACPGCPACPRCSGCPACSACSGCPAWSGCSGCPACSAWSGCPAWSGCSACPACSSSTGRSACSGSARRAGSGPAGHAASHDGSSAHSSLEPKSSWRGPGQFAVASGEPSESASTGRPQCRVLPSRRQLAEPAERSAKGGPRHPHSPAPGAYPMRRRGGLPIWQDALMVRA